MPQERLTPTEAEQRIRDIGLGDRPRFSLSIGDHVGLRFDDSDERLDAFVVDICGDVATVVDHAETWHEVTIPEGGVPLAGQADQAGREAASESDPDDVSVLIAADLAALPGLLGPDWRRIR